MNSNRVKEMAVQVLGQSSWPDLNQNYLVAVSGGADSVCLLSIMKDLIALQGAALNDRVHVAHFNHKLRGDESDQDQAFVRRLCQSWGFQFHTADAVVPTNMTASSETWARQVRHSFFQELRSQLGPCWLVLGHHQDDRAETILINIFRGSGLTGLTAMPAVDRRRMICRPLLYVQRDEILDYLDQHRLEYRQDASNTEMGTWRNQLRHEVLPILKTYFDDNLVQRISRLGDLATIDVKYLERQADETYRQHVKLVIGSDVEFLYQLFDVSTFSKIDKSVRLRVLIKILTAWKGDSTDLSSDLVLDLDRQLSDDFDFLLADPDSVIANRGALRHLPGKVQLHRSRLHWRFYMPDLLGKYEGPIEVPIYSPKDKAYLYSKLYLLKGNDKYQPLRQFLSEQGRFFSTEQITLQSMDCSTYNNVQLFFVTHDLDDYCVRSREQGDTLQFRNDNRCFTKRIKQYFQERRIWAELRDRICLVSDGESIIWIPGMVRARGDELTVEKLTKIEFL